MDEWLTPREVAAHLGVTPRTVQRWIADGRLSATRVGSRVRVSRSSLSGVVETGERHAIREISCLLVANRGEIAARIARTARAAGIRVVGVHAPDEPAPAGMDDRHEVGSYLDAEAMLEIARRSGADAVHPGYGFLAENPSFARAVFDAGLTWVGPPADAIAAMGDKAEARRRAAALGVPTVRGYDGEAQDDLTLGEEAERVGFPLLVKPSAGGGGKGMRVVRRRDDLREALAAARREADRSFGDDRLILERFLAGSRHVEIQVLFDAHGNGMHLGERDCSSQRRNQKIVEEAPAPSVGPALRERMGAAALSVASAVGYVSAGTVEMLLTDSGEFFFLEMNTRLQVEHPVTEAVTDRDLVADQLRIAAGATLAQLGLRDAPPPIRGHAIEARLYAEDPEAGFLPATGMIELLSWPVGVRVDAGVQQGDEVTDRYDPMLAKLVAHGATRAEAVDRLGEALQRTVVLGVRTNLRFLRWLIDQPPMRDGEMRTNTIEKLDLPPPPRPEERHWRAAAFMAMPVRPGPWGDGWRLNAPAVRRLRHDGAERTIPLDSGTGEGTSRARTGPAAIAGRDAIHVDVDGQSLDFSLAPAPSVEEAARHAATVDGDGISLLVAPMPGRVIAVHVEEGASVHAHQPVVVIEAMKMEHAVVAPIEGIVARVLVTQGQQVQRGDTLAEVAPQSSP